MPRRMTVIASLALACALAPRLAFADDEPPVDFHLKIDLPILVTAGALWATGVGVQGVIVQPTCDPCDPQTVNPLDRGLAGRGRDALADGFSYGTFAAALLAPLVVDRLDLGWRHHGWRDKRKWRDWAIDTGVYAETLALDGMINQLVKLIARRPRPYAYGLPAHDPTLRSSESFVSFYSEHSSLTFAAAAAYTTLFTLRHPDRKGACALVGSLMFALATTTAALRVQAGAHFYTDVLAGALVGSALGALVPLLHARARPLPVVLAPVQGGAVALFTWAN